MGEIGLNRRGGPSVYPAGDPRGGNPGSGAVEPIPDTFLRPLVRGYQWEP
jgi:hypothetical protein